MYVRMYVCMCSVRTGVCGTIFTVSVQLTTYVHAYVYAILCYVNYSRTPAWELSLWTLIYCWTCRLVWVLNQGITRLGLLLDWPIADLSPASWIGSVTWENCVSGSPYLAWLCSWEGPPSLPLSLTSSEASHHASKCSSVMATLCCSITGLWQLVTGGCTWRPVVPW